VQNKQLYIPAAFGGGDNSAFSIIKNSGIITEKKDFA
jgi:hypothetical protein